MSDYTQLSFGKSAKLVESKDLILVDGEVVEVTGTRRMGSVCVQCELEGGQKVNLGLGTDVVTAEVVTIGKR